MDIIKFLELVEKRQTEKIRLSKEEIEGYIIEFEYAGAEDLVGQGKHENFFFLTNKGIILLQQKRIENSIKKLDRIMDTFSADSSDYSQVLVFLTIMLVLSSIIQLTIGTLDSKIAIPLLIMTLTVTIWLVLRRLLRYKDRLKLNL
jgi:hypothetical protein